MSRKDWQALIRRFANGRPSCNCGDAYYTPDEYGRLRCGSGCSANLLIARDEVAARVRELAELRADIDSGAGGVRGAASR